jgi:hypothetical protein
MSQIGKCVSNIWKCKRFHTGIDFSLMLMFGSTMVKLSSFQDGSFQINVFFGVLFLIYFFFFCKNAFYYYWPCSFSGKTNAERDYNAGFLDGFTDNHKNLEKSLTTDENSVE